ncbi:M48 family metalloprotease [endosymbiont of Ridgeia piscesae]|uniref:Putative beta-barrel assembly-enhancing protease n=1 Tax=endosymbiont of Ridgeia piscesae TaxID=54398 RepID=A0A0T5Z6K5_9GAMM|nr:M48 family metalloprotease [endosymbiont of Ridgeia piscesae]KRT58257.1 putative Zn-dependent protease [endosymbiont of Ridgeia piscesae]
MKRFTRPSIQLLLALITALFAAVVSLSFAADGDLAPAPGGILLPELGSPSDQYLTPADETRLGREFIKNVRETQDVVDEPLIDEYIQSMGRQLVEQSDAAGGQFHFFVIRSPVINAFAGPGGYIGIYSGLILASQSESELASVVAHEIAHVTQKHLLRAFDAANRMSGKTAALLLAAVLIGASASGEAGMAIAAGAQANALQQQINFTRSNEQEADHVGIGLLADANFDPRSMPIFFERLTDASRLYENGIPEILRTHPVTTNRIADALNRADTYPYRQYTSSHRYYLVREMLRVSHYDKPADAVKYYAEGLKQERYLNQEAHRFGYVLALQQAGDPDQAEKMLQPLLKQRPTETSYIQVQARIALARREMEQALQTLQTAYLLLPNDYPLAIHYAETLLKAGKQSEVDKVIDQLRALRPREPRLLRLAARAAQARGKQTESHRQLAEAYVFEGDLAAAINQLEIALKQPDKGDFYLQSQLEARLQELQQRHSEAQAKSQ